MHLLELHPSEGSADGSTRHLLNRDPRVAHLIGALKQRFNLTTSEIRVALLLDERWSNREIADALGVSEHTARRHTEKVLLKLGIHSRTHVRSVIGAIGLPRTMQSRGEIARRPAAGWELSDGERSDTAEERS